MPRSRCSERKIPERREGGRVSPSSVSEALLLPDTRSHTCPKSRLLSLIDHCRADPLSLRVCFLWSQGHFSAAHHLQRKTGHPWPQGH